MAEKQCSCGGTMHLVVEAWPVYDKEGRTSLKLEEYRCTSCYKKERYEIPQATPPRRRRGG